MATSSGGGIPPSRRAPSTPPPSGSESEDNTDGEIGSSSAFGRRVSSPDPGLTRPRLRRSDSELSTASGTDEGSKKGLTNKRVSAGDRADQAYDPSYQVRRRPAGDDDLKARQDEKLKARSELIESLRNDMANEWVQKHLQVLIKVLEDPEYASSIGFSVIAELDGQEICLAPPDYQQARQGGVSDQQLDDMRSYVVSSLKGLWAEKQGVEEIEDSIKAGKRQLKEIRKQLSRELFIRVDAKVEEQMLQNTCIVLSLADGKARVSGEAGGGIPEAAVEKSRKAELKARLLSIQTSDEAEEADDEAETDPVASRSRSSSAASSTVLPDSALNSGEEIETASPESSEGLYVNTVESEPSGPTEPTLSPPPPPPPPPVPPAPPPTPELPRRPTPPPTPELPRRPTPRPRLKNQPPPPQP